MVPMVAGHAGRLENIVALHKLQADGAWEVSVPEVFVPLLHGGAVVEPLRKFRLGETDEGGLKVIFLVLARGVLGRQQQQYEQEQQIRLAIAMDRFCRGAGAGRSRARR